MISHLLRVMIAREYPPCWRTGITGWVADRNAGERDVPAPAVTLRLIPRADHLMLTDIDLTGLDGRMARKL